MFIVDLFCDEYKATIISTTGKTQICPRTFSKKFLSDNSDLKLRNLEFGYNFPKSIVEKATLSGLRLYLSGQNLAGLSNLIGVDPEIQETNGLAYPTTRIVNIGLTVKF
ncbi:hypothetical protein [Petrimonas mucosa]|uniref:hypothetical protein n=1 Tax=Petrimonas mucosa TaxID=1642646 RepID=UPI0012B58097|nr:hypothetical protein [Petrimonas mucosa]